MYLNNEPVARCCCMSGDGCADCSSKVLNDRLNSNTFEVIVGQYRRVLEPLEPGAQRIFVTDGVRHQNYNPTYLCESDRHKQADCVVRKENRVGKAKMEEKEEEVEK